jgi:uncharacterized protein YbaR (Trm112 family)
MTNIYEAMRCPDCNTQAAVLKLFDSSYQAQLCCPDCGTTFNIAGHPDLLTRLPTLNAKTA